MVSRAEVRVRPPRLKPLTAGATGSSTGDAATDTEPSKRRLSELHRLNSRKGSLNATYRRNAEANDKAYDLNQKSVPALDALAKEYVDFDVTMVIFADEQEAGGTLHNATLEVAEELERTLKEQGRLQDDLDSLSDVLTAAAKEFADCWAAHEATGAKPCHAFRESSNRRAFHDELSVAAKQALQRTLEEKRKATELQEDVAIQRERTRRIMNEHAGAEGHVNDGIGSLGKALQAAARATHSLTCGVPGRESNEVKYLRKATELTHRGMAVPPPRWATSECPCLRPRRGYFNRTKMTEPIRQRCV